ncbi:hypothetical protein QBC46DRAFT_379504 [Diplogelasinospora grovesii]|uniref:Uncharacterized protein n=1 Tax=Diplogelasinospora grovesii TaxID=303347 RepID=A0AAN6NE86_9PEZI|nr:hypothetical protein QBC46DRAFT_379504 [Diplogelasinospora grovesii]
MATIGVRSEEAAQLPSSDSFVRLHVTPLDTDLVKVVLSSTLLPKARNISYHNLETFPEKRYGFLELPTEDAEKLRNKLNGAVLRGVKIRIEKARPAKIPTPIGDAAMGEHKTSRKDKEGTKSKKRKHDDSELSGVVLEEGRKVKRGWTATDEPKEKEKRDRSKKDKKDKKDKKERKKDKKQIKSKYTDHAECLIKTVLPPNAAALPDANDDSSKKKQKKSKSREVVIHEFEKTTKFPTFLKESTSTTKLGAPLEFVNGKGWVDENGNVVEAVKGRPPVGTTTKVSQPKKVQEKEQQQDKESSSSGESSDEGSESDDEDASAPQAKEQEESQTENDGESDSSEEDAPAPRKSPLKMIVTSPSTLKSDPARPKSPSSARSLSIKIPPVTPQEAKVVHPLEALYKRPKNEDGTATQESSGPATFSFFGKGDEELSGEEEEAGTGLSLQVPMTPFSRQDFEFRGMRSAAPTPDTAHPSRSFKPWSNEEDDIVEDDHEDDVDGDVEQMDVDADGAGAADAPSAEQGEERPSSDFQKWFWENRGDLNRSWKKRRKTVAKEKRYRDNRARMDRAI